MMNETDEILNEQPGEEAACPESDDETAEREALAEETEEDVPEQAEEKPDSSDALEEERERYLRLYAEFDNFRKRTSREKLEAYSEATARCIEQLLPVVDNFERAVDAACSDEKYHSGMVMILNQLRAFLEKAGVREIIALGAAFDPNVHNAIKQSEATEEYPENTVCEVFQKGYMLGDRLIRPAMVAVAN